MKKTIASRLWPNVMMPLFLSAATLIPMAAPVLGQAPQSATLSLLEKAHGLEARGRMDMAAQTWQQVLLADPNNTVALGGLARAAKMSGNPVEAQKYIDKLRRLNPNDPDIARAETVGTNAERQAQLRQAGKLAQQGQYGEAMAVYRQVYGDTPPQGEQALGFYETEAATEDGRPHAISGLRMLSEKNPGDARYQIALGRILTYNPKTRAEGRKLLAAHSADPAATEALRHSLLWDVQNPSSGGQIRGYLATHPDAQLAEALRTQPRAGDGGRRRNAVPQTAEQRAASALAAGRNAESRAAYRALNEKRFTEAETRFKAILARSPNNPDALAGMGYLRMQQANFGGAISFLVQAKQDGSKDAGVEPALVTSRFWYTMGEGAIALDENDLSLAEKQYRVALGMRPDSTEALEALGGTLLRAEQPMAAMPYFQQFVKLNPAAAHAWRGLFLAETGAGETQMALETERRIPLAPRSELARDPLFLRALASAYVAAGREADAQRVLQAALDLPFSTNAAGLRAGTQLQYAGLLQEADHLEQAAGLYHQVLLKDPANTEAWQGLVRVQHAMGRDAEALQTLESMPAASLAMAMKEPGFQSTVASVYQGDQRLDLAQDVLEKAIAQQTAAGQKPFVSNEVQLAGIYLDRGNGAQAYPLYQQILVQNPDRLDAWKGVLAALHTGGRDQEALAEIQQIPAATRVKLEQDPEYLLTVGGVYTGLGQPAQAEIFLRRVQDHYAQQHTLPPSGLDVQSAWLMYNGGNDAGLYRQLLELGGRQDLTDDQRRTVQTIWANWAVRRANQASANGNFRRAQAILNAAAQSFQGNPAVIKILATGYARAGMSRQAVQIWKAQDLQDAPATDYRAAAGAALAGNDLKDAEIWLRFGLDKYPRDPDLLNLAAKFEEARGDNHRAVDYLNASLANMPKPDPGADLATELGAPAPGAPALPNLAALLKPNKQEAPAQDMVEQAPSGLDHPYLPSAGSGYGPAPIQLNQPTMLGPANPSPGRSPVYPASPAGATPGARLRDYVPQSRMTQPLNLNSPEDRKFSPEGSNLVLAGAAYHPQQIAVDRGFGPELQQASAQSASGQQAKPALLTDQPASVISQQKSVSQQQQAAPPPSDEVYGAYVPYKAPAPVVPPQANPLPAPVAPRAEAVAVHSKAHHSTRARARAATPARSTVGPLTTEPMGQAQAIPAVPTGQSKPPAEEYNIQAEPVQYAPLQSGGAAGTQIAQPVRGSNLPPQQSTGLAPQQVYQQQSPLPQQGGDSYGQQYPQPGAARSAHNRHVRQRHAPRPAAGQTQPAAQPLPEQQPVQPGMSYPGISQPLSYQPYPAIGPAYPLGAPPTDYDLMQKRVPPLRGGYGDTLPVQSLVLTPRQQTERDLETLEASYSGWLGGTGSARYRSGRVGLERLTDLEVTAEASVVVNRNIRLTVVPRAVFLNSGTLDTGQFAGQTTGVPVLGTLPANAVTAPPQQVANGVGGELQVSGRNFAVAAGYTPYEFLVRNVTGRALFQPNRHFTLYFDRSPVTETQLSYAGLRDPGTATAVYGGNIWGGVISTGGGVRFDYGDERAGFYLTAAGADVTGYHVLDNNKFEGSAGAYFLAHTFPGYGRLNVGAQILGEHFAHNERGLSYGNGGYFSPNAYFLATVPVTFTGRYRDNFHYSLAGSLGVQTFQEDYALFFPLDPGIQNTYTSTANGGQPCSAAQTANHTCAQYPVNSNTGGNYGINAEGAYRIYDHWYAGGFLTANNTNNYNTVTGGFFVRYLFKRQISSEEYPTGLFPVSGFRPLRVP